MKKTSDIHK